MIKIEVQMLSGEWQECMRFATYNHGIWSVPAFATGADAQAAIDADSLVASWQHAGIIRLVVAPPTQDGVTTAVRTAGQIAYENDLSVKPTYHDGTPRRPWKLLPEIVRWTWERTPTAIDP